MSKSSTQKSRPPASLLIWILPVLALGVVIWIAYQSKMAEGPTIEITFDNGQGLVAGKTLLLYRGIEVGEVEATKLSKDLSLVIATVQLTNESDGIAVEGSQFWIARPEISLTGISGLDTILSGVYIQVNPGRGVPVSRFQGVTNAPVPSESKALTIILFAKRTQSIEVGSPVNFRDIQVGQIKGIALSDDGQSVTIEATIESAFGHLIRKETKFWNESGIHMQAGLLGVKIRTDSLETIIRGGVSFATPSFEEAGSQVESQSVFTLYEEPEKAWLEWIGKPQP